MYSETVRSVSNLYSQGASCIHLYLILKKNINMKHQNVVTTENATTLRFKIVETITPRFTEDYEQLKGTIDIPVEDFNRDILSLALTYAKCIPDDLDIPEDYPYLVTPDNFVTDEPIATFSKDVIAILTDAEGDESPYSLDFNEEYGEFAKHCISVGICNEDQLLSLAELLRIEYSKEEPDTDLDSILNRITVDPNKPITLRIEKSITTSGTEVDSLINDYKDFEIDLKGDIWSGVKQASEYQDQGWRSFDISPGQTINIEDYHWDVVLRYTYLDGSEGIYSYENDSYEDLHEVLSNVLGLSPSDSEQFADHLSLRLLGYNDDMFIHDEEAIESLREEYYG